MVGVATIGCAAPGGRVGADAWVSRHGGLCDFEHTRVASVVTRLIGSSSAEPSRSIRVDILDADELAAYAWPGARVVVTRGLVAATRGDDAALAAAIAHELGHLIADGHLPNPPAALRGWSADEPDVESRADLVGRELLAIHGFDPDGMRRLLVRLRTAHGGASARNGAHLDRRGARLAPRAASADEPEPVQPRKSPREPLVLRTTTEVRPLG